MSNRPTAANFTLRDHVRGVGKHAHDLNVAQLDHHLESAGVEKITDEDARRIAPKVVCGPLPSAQGRMVDDVIVKECRRVQELDDGRKLHAVVAACAAGRGGEENNKWTQALAARFDDVRADFFDKGDVRRQTSRNEGVERGELVKHRIVKWQIRGGARF